MPIEPIPENAVDLSIEPPEFETLAILELGNAATPSDGFDGMMFEAVTNLAGTNTERDPAPIQLGEMEQALSELQTDEVSPVRIELADAHAEGERILSDFGVDMGTIDPPPPPPPPPPPGGTGGGGGGGPVGGGGGSGTGVGGGPSLDPCPTDSVRAGGICIPVESLL